MDKNRIKATLSAVALCFSAVACATPPQQRQGDVLEGAAAKDIPQTAPVDCESKNVLGAFSGSATQSVLDGIGKKLNIRGLGQYGGRAVEKQIKCPKPDGL